MLLTKQTILVVVSAWVATEMLDAAPTPTPTPKPRRSFKITWTAAQQNSPKPTPTASKKVASSPTVTPKPVKSDANSGNKAHPSPTLTPSAPAKEKNASSSDKAPGVAAKSSPTAAKSSVSPSSEKSAIEIKFIKFQPMQGEPGEADYNNARLTYLVNVSGSKNVNFPSIHFSIEGSQKLFERHFVPPAGTAPLQPGESFQRIVSLDPTLEGEWSDAYEKTDRAKFTWTVEGQAGGSVEMPLHKAWP